MASARRPRTSFRPVIKSTEGGTDREEDVGEKSKQRKRKLADMLGPPWSKGDLEQFYQAFRRHGKDWKKVSGSLHKRTVEMVEALYTTNKAYLSLPEGAASAAGLIAMMTDHYNLLDGSQSPDEETSDEIGGSDDPSNHTQPAKVRKGVDNVAMESSSIRPNGLVGSTSSGGPSPAKKPRTHRSRTVGKRTPRFPSSAFEKRAKISKVSHSNLHERVEDDALSNMATASNRVSKGAASPSGSHTPSRRSLRQATVQSNGDKEFLLRTFSDASVKPAASTSEAGVVPEGSPESKELHFDGGTKESSSNLGDGRSGGAARSPAVADSSMKSKRGTPKKVKVPNPDEKHKSTKSLERMKEDAKELLEAAERKNSGGGEDAAEDSSQIHSAQRRRRLVSPPQRPKKRSRQLFSGDSNSGLDALATLAASSLDGLELEGLELGESLNVVANAAACLEDKVEGAEAKSGEQSMSNVKQSNCDTRLQEGEVEPGLEDTGDEVVEERKGEEQGATLDDRQLSISPPDSGKRKRRLSGDKVPKGQGSTPEGEPTAILKSRIKLKRAEVSKTSHSNQEPKLVKEAVVFIEVGESVSHGFEASVDGGGESAMDIDESSLPLKLRSKKKGLPEKLFTEKIISPPAPLSGVATIYKEPPKREPPFCPHTTHDLSSASAKARIIHCLCPKVRRWCMCEWFYSAIDLPWFARNEFVEYLNHAGLGHVPRLTRVEWGVIRGSLGKPRRLSKRFLQEEREKLETYRESVRTHYHELRTGVRDGLPTDLARPLTVGQKVIARHPKTSEIHDGSILTVDRSRCRVQFDRPELGVELVKDIDAMPIHPLENMPEVMRRRRVVVDGIDRSLVEDVKVDLKLKSWSDSGGVGGAARAALNERLERRFTLLSQRFLNDLSKRAQADTLDAVREAKEVTNRAVREAKEVTMKAAIAAQRVGQRQSCSVAQSQAREADARALADLSHSLDKKEALVMELRQMNDEASCNHGEFRTSEAFQRQYATIVLQLKDVNKQVTNALLQLRQRNKYQDNVVPPWHRLTSQGTITHGNSDVESSDCTADTAPALAEMTVLARKHARLMVTTAVNAMDSLKVGDDALQKLGCALEAIPRAGSASSPLPVPAHGAPAMQEGDAPQGAFQPGSLGQSSSSSVTEENTENDAGTMASSSRELQARETNPCTIEAAAHDLVQHLSQAGNGSKEGAFLTELMTSCVATLFMLQTLADSPYSTTDLQQTLDSALMTLRPKSSKNSFVYKEIEQQIGIMKTQIMAHIPVPSSMSFMDMSNGATHTS